MTRDVRVLLLACCLPAAVRCDELPGTKPLEPVNDMAAATVAGVDRYLLRALEESIPRRTRHWRRDLSSPAAYAASVQPNRERLARILGVRDRRVPFTELEFVSPGAPPEPLARAAGYTVWAVRWPALEGIRGEGLLLEPAGKPAAGVVAIPDCGQSPEMLAGLVEGVPRESQFARRLAENGCRVLVPALIDRGMELSAGPASRTPPRVTHREQLYRPAYQMGRHLIGYEIQKVFAAVDWLARDGAGHPLGVVGYGEGGLLALDAGALDRRIKAVGVSGYFDSRQDLWREPIDHNIFGLLAEFGDAEIASLVAPRPLLIEACALPAVNIPPGSNSGPGRLATPPVERVRHELARLTSLIDGLTPRPRAELYVSGDGTGPFGSPPFVEGFLKALGGPKTTPAGPSPVRRGGADLAARIRDRERRQFFEIRDFSEGLIDASADVRDRYTAKLYAGGSAETYAAIVKPYRDDFERTIIGKIEQELSAPNPRTRLTHDTPEFRGYEVALDVLPDVPLYGVLLLPKDLKPGEKRPVVVCQHGLEGRAQDTVEGDHTSYRDFASRLARRGFITFSPQHLYRGGDAFRTLQRKANPLGLSLFSVMVAQHRQLLRWLGTLEGVDPRRIAFYGISYGGKSAMRIPAVLEGYCLSVCSSDFSDWVWRTVSSRHGGGYLMHAEYEIFEFDLGNTFNYAEMAALICPRPFMAEQFHDRDSFSRRARAEFSKIQSLYEGLGIGERAAIAYYPNFESRGPYLPRQTFDFLHTHLRWPAK